MQNIKLTIEYIGKGYSGFAEQPGQKTVAGEIKKVLKQVFGHQVKFTACSRTDSGVHALSQALNFKVKTKIPPKKLPRIFNSFLPHDIQVLKAEEVPLEYNSRFAPKSKTYEYLIFNGKMLPVHYKGVVWHVRQKLDLSAMRKAAKVLEGEHDFSSFCARGSRANSFVRTIYSIKISKKTLNLWNKLEVISLKFKGNAFLYKMVRNLVGTLMDAGMGKMTVEDVKKLLDARNRRLAGKTAPPQALCLVKVEQKA